MTELTQLRADLPWLADVPRNVCSDLLCQLDLAWQRCFKRLAQQPRFKKKDRDVLNMKEPHNKLFRIDQSAVVFPKLGRIRAVIHRPLVGKQKTCALVRDGDQWFACIVAEETVPEPVPRAEPMIAIDRGVTIAFADSDGGMVPNPRFAENAARRLARAQRIVSRRKKGSKNREKAKARVSRIHRKVRRQRDHFLHEQSIKFAKSHGVIVLEKLNVQNMVASAAGTIEKPGSNVRAKSGLNRSIAGVGWTKFVGFLHYKAAALGGRVEEVPAAYSSQTCSACGHCAKENRKSQASFVCVSCGYAANADTNAAKVLLSRRTAVEPTVDVCGGSAALGRPVKQKLRTARSVNNKQSGYDGTGAVAE